MLAADASTLFDFSVDQCGALARPMFDRAPGQVTAVFDHSFYIEIGGVTACVVGRDGFAAPFNLVSSASRSVNWRASGLRAASHVCPNAAGFVVANRFRFDMAAAQIWRPPAPALDWNVATLRSGLAALRAIAAQRAPADGLGRLVCRPDGPGAVDALAMQAEPAIARLRTVLMAALRAPHRAVASDFDDARALLGLGPGLTPSGDDFIGGMMIALHVAGYDEISELLWRCVAAVADTRTHAIARSHLAGAAQGMGSAAVHHVLNAAVEGRTGDLARLSDDIDQLGHTSGWDILAGAICVFDAI